MRSSGTGLIRARSTAPVSMPSTRWSVLPTVTPKPTFGKASLRLAISGATKSPATVERIPSSMPSLRPSKRRAGVLDGQLELAQGCCRGGTQSFTFLSELHAAAGSAKERDSEVFFEEPHLAAQGR